MDMDLIWVEDLHGDAINWMGCRSLWKDKYGNIHRCNSLFKTSYFYIARKCFEDIEKQFFDEIGKLADAAAEKRAKNQQQ
jgi:hypothetical protein